MEGNKLASSSLPIETSLTGETVTQLPTEWWEKACKVIRETVTEIGCSPIVYLTVTSSSSCLVCVDQQGEALFPCMMVSDKRAQEESDIIKRAAAFSIVERQTGLGADSSLMLPKALWIKRHQRQVFDQVYKFLSPNDYLIAKFTGRYVTDYMNAHKWHYNMEEKRYPSDLLNEVGISEHMLPEVVAPGSYAGNILEAVSRETGLAQETKVILSAYDAI